MTLRTWWRRAKEWILPARRITISEEDGLPQRLLRRHLILVREGGEEWCVAMQCPCGCGQRVELPLIPEAVPRWSLHIDGRERPTLHPSVWLRDGCRSHYFVRSGKVVWV